MSIKDVEGMDQIDRAVLANQIVLGSVMKQIHYLQTKDRLPLIILISYATLSAIVDTMDVSNKPLLLSRVAEIDTPICVISGLPLYFSPKLTRSGVMVVGEVEWQY